MAWRFGSYRLDPERFELSRNGEAVRAEPQVLSLLIYLVRNRHRMVPRDELLDAVWKNRSATEATLSSRVRSARMAVGDEGAHQTVIRTLHGNGFRFIAEVEDEGTTVEARPSLAPVALPPRGRPSIAVLPFRPLGLDNRLEILAEAIPYEVIQALSRLRWLSVTARGSSFRFSLSDANHALVATALGVRYLLSGIIETVGQALAVSFELTDSGTSEIIWAERLVGTLAEIDDLRHRIVVRVVAALEIIVPETEAQHALVTGADRFDAWSSYHVGMRHLYRFTTTDNAIARAHFEQSANLDPTLARAQAGLSFTSFLEAFLRISPDVRSSIAAARRHAERGLELDSLDPFVNFVMGRSHWLTHDLDEARHWLSRATTLNPNYAQGFYASAFTSMLLGDSKATNTELDSAFLLSPLDPLLYGMHGVRAQMLIQQGDYAAAAHYAGRAVASPGAHYLIGMIAVVAYGLAGQHEEAARWRAKVRKLKRDASEKDYFNAFPTSDSASRPVIAAQLRRHGF